MKTKRKSPTSTQMYHALDRVINKTYERLIDHTLIKINGVYVLNNSYAISQDTKSNITTVTRKRDHSVFNFNSMKLALIWSVLDHNKLRLESNRVKLLDGLIIGLTVEQQIHERLRSRDHVIYANKLQQDRDRLKKYNLEINKYIKLANKLQNKELQK
jgi:hypothetical protein